MRGVLVFGLAAFLALGGLVGCLAGLVGLGQVRRLAGAGVRVRALVRYRVLSPEDDSAGARPLLQFVTGDDQVVEVFSPVASTRRVPPVDGGWVWLRCDPADPTQVLLEGRERRWLERAFVGSGAAVMLGAVALAAAV